jgi:hypothetical protein
VACETVFYVRGYAQGVFTVVAQAEIAVMGILQICVVKGFSKRTAPDYKDSVPQRVISNPPEADEKSPSSTDFPVLAGDFSLAAYWRSGLARNDGFPGEATPSLPE